MDNAYFTLTSTEETRAGAMACLEALRDIQKIAEGPNPDSSKAGWWREKDSAVAVMLRAAGNPGGFMAGFIATLAEYVKDDLSSVGCYPDDWEEPEAAMTDEEKTASRTRFDEECAKVVEDSRITEEDKEERAYQEAANLAKSWLDRMPGNADAFKRLVCLSIARQVEISLDCYGRDRGGYSFTKKTIREFDDAINLACNILRNGEVEYCEYERDNEVRRLVSDAFNRDMSLRLTGHERNRLIERFIREREQESADAHA